MTSLSAIDVSISWLMISGKAIIDVDDLVRTSWTYIGDKGGNINVKEVKEGGGMMV